MVDGLYGGSIVLDSFLISTSENKMSITKSEFAITELAHLETASSQAQVTLSFEETQGVRVAAWAAAKFGAEVLVDRTVNRYNRDPVRTKDGNPVHIADVGMQKWQYELEEAAMVGQEVAADLASAVKRLERGYPLDSFSVRGVADTTAVIGSLERAVEAHPDNLGDGEHYMQAAARYMLDHMQATDSQSDKSIAYLI